MTLPGMRQGLDQKMIEAFLFAPAKALDVGGSLRGLRRNRRSG
jgi:hypothetical protein